MGKKYFLGRFILFAGMMVFGTILNHSMASAATITVNDFGDGMVLDGKCNLREAIYAATVDGPASLVYGCNTQGSGDDTIVFQNWISISTTATLSISNTNVTIDGGVNGNKSTISGQNTHSVFTIKGGNVKLKNLIIVNGKSTSDIGGGGVYTKQSNLTIEASTIKNNEGYASGGGIFQKGGTLIIKNSSITNNKVFYSGNSSDEIIAEGGGGIGVEKIAGEDSITSISYSKITDNLANQTLFAGGINNHGGKMTINHTLISKNTAQASGGAILNGLGGSIKIENSQIYNNTATTVPLTF